MNKDGTKENSRQEQQQISNKALKRKGSALSSSNTRNMDDDNDDNDKNVSVDPKKIRAQAGKIEELKAREVALSRLLAAVRREKLAALRSRPLTIGVVGFGRFGQFIAQTFAKHGRVVATSRSDYTELAEGMGITYVKLSDPQAFLNEDLDVIVLATSITSFEDTVGNLAPHLHTYIREHKDTQMTGPLIVDVLSVKEHPRQVMLQLLPKECDILCTHPMFGPDSGKHGWHGLNFVFERTRIDNMILDPSDSTRSFHHNSNNDNNNNDNHSSEGGVDNNNNNEAESFVNQDGSIHSIHENSEAHIEGMDRMERFLSIWEEEGCRMVQMSCKDHDSYAANSQFITHLMGRILGEQGLSATPIDTKGFQSVLKLIGSTTADSFDLFYGLYKYNQNSMNIILKLRDSMDGVVQKLKEMEQDDKESPRGIKRVHSLIDFFPDQASCLEDEKAITMDDSIFSSAEEKKVVESEDSVFA
eukprot:CAMPEP_0197827044 /NCGR_PEP_ID=MMETSP1437-20131217/3918_1 /TAXON_ID=49252 ORGANISM="Eucampia antarctica, Strain CCMP1452" /NCGR_SAMPLE_ID=MMETSP1437 /ASSEMBLY_ACC=CAM_ASM_001096 /LENGTH=472 /DNA_ID=CAMNT_0043427753 /DNA_START=246 /DNA_END=1664 /DNA_ORIENTATION=+